MTKTLATPIPTPAAVVAKLLALLWEGASETAILGAKAELGMALAVAGVK